MSDAKTSVVSIGSGDSSETRVVFHRPAVKRAFCFLMSPTMKFACTTREVARYLRFSKNSNPDGKSQLGSLPTFRLDFGRRQSKGKKNQHRRRISHASEFEVQMTGMHLLTACFCCDHLARVADIKIRASSTCYASLTQDDQNTNIVLRAGDRVAGQDSCKVVTI